MTDTNPTSKPSNPSSDKRLPVLAEEKIKENYRDKMGKIRLGELEDATASKAVNLHFPYINLTKFPVSGDTLNQISKEVAEAEKVVCFYKADDVVKIGSTDPLNPNINKILEDLKKETIGGQGELYLISDQSYQTIFKLYEKFPPPREFIVGVKITGDELETLQKELKNFGILNAKLNEERNMTNVVKMILANAFYTNASDISLETQEMHLRIRFNIDGIWHVVATLPPKNWHSLSSRIKSISGMKINISDIPQDGRITVFLKKDDKLEIRVNAAPTSYGGTIDMRLLRSNIASLKFEDLGLRGKAYEDLKMSIGKTTGIIITTGPTGSGKTTTLYAILNKLNTPEVKIFTLEDPVEYKIEGIIQSQIEEDRGYSFADGLRALMRQNPDIIMVGEIRDLDTAMAAIQAALTGHRVISTLHTNDAAGAIPRLLSMKVAPHLLAPALNGVIGQRLVRRIHEKCKIEQQLEPEVIAKVQESLSNLPANSGYTVDLNKVKFYRGQGCDECNNIGYKGRVGIYEIFSMNAEVEKEILSGQASEYRIADINHNNGMITMKQDGLLKAIDGLTSVEEVFRVIG